MSEIQVWKVFLMRKSVDAHVTGRFRRRKGRDTEEKKSLGNCETSTSEDASKTSRRIPWVNQSGAIVAEKQMARHKKGSDDLVQGLLARSPEVRMESIRVEIKRNPVRCRIRAESRCKRLILAVNLFVRVSPCRRWGEGAPGQESVPFRQQIL